MPPPTSDAALERVLARRPMRSALDAVMARKPGGQQVNTNMAGMPEEGSAANQPPPAAAPSRTRPYPVMGAPGVDPKWAGAFAAARGSQGPTFVPTGGMNEQPAEPAGPGFLATTAAKIVPRAERAVANIEALGRGAVEGARRVASGEITNLPELLMGGIPVEPWKAQAPKALGLQNSSEMEQVAAQGGAASDMAATVLGLPFDLADPANAYENVAATVTGAKLAKAAAPILQMIESLAGPVVARTVAQGLENGTPGAAIAGLQQAQQEDWKADPWGAAGRTFRAAGAGLAAGTAAGTAFEAAGGRLTKPLERRAGAGSNPPETAASVQRKDSISYAEPTQPGTAGNTAEVAGKQAETAAQPPTVPEKPATIAAQLDLLAQGKKRAVLITPGEAMPTVPEGMREARSQAGVFIYDPTKVSLREIRAAVKENRIGDVLDYGTPAKPEPGTEVGAVTVRKADGTEVQAVITDEASLPDVVKAAERVAGEGDTIRLENPAEVIAGRVEPGTGFAGSGVDQVSSSSVIPPRPSRPSNAEIAADLGIEPGTPNWKNEVNRRLNESPKYREFKRAEEAWRNNPEKLAADRQFSEEMAQTRARREQAQAEQEAPLFMEQGARPEAPRPSEPPYIPKGVEPPSAPTAKQPPAGFTTARGSTYELVGNRTRRRKFDGSEHDLSDRTVYIDADAQFTLANELHSLDESTVRMDGNRLTLQTGHGANRKVVRNIPYKQEPAVGLVPIEVWNKTRSGEIRWHAGHEIVTVSDSPTQAPKPAPEPSAKPAEPPPRPLEQVQQGDKQPGVAPVPALHEGQPTTLVDRLKRIEDDALGRIKTRRAPRGPNVGATTIFDDAVDAAVYVAARAARAGVTGGKALSDLVSKSLAELGDEFKDKGPKVRRMALAMLRDSVGADKAIDPELLDRNAAEAIRIGRASRKAEAASERNRAVIDTGMAVEKRQQQAAATRTSKAVREAKRQARTEARNNARIELDALRATLTESAQRRRQVEAVKDRALDQAGARIRKLEREKLAAETAAGVRARIRELAEDHLSVADRGKLLPAIEKARTGAQLNRAINQIVDTLAESQTRADMRTIDRLTTKQRLATLANTDDAPRARAAKAALAEAKAALADKALTKSERSVLVRSAAERIQQIHADQKAEKTQYVLGRKVHTEHVRKKMVEAVRTKQELPKPTEVAAEREPGVLGRLALKELTPDSLFRTLDNDMGGKGPFAAMLREWKRGRRKALELERDFMVAADKIVSGLGYKNLAEFLARVSGTLGKAGQELVDVPLGGVRKITKGQAMYIEALDPETRGAAARGQRFSFKDSPSEEGWKLTNEDRIRIADALSGSELAAVAKLKQLYDSMFFDAMDRISLSLNGRRLDKVAGYWGVQRNMDLSDKIGQAAGWRGIMAKHLENDPRLKAREGGKVPIFIGDFGSDLMSRVKSASKLVSQAEMIRLAEMTMLHPEVRTEIAKRYGAKTVERIQVLLRNFAGGEQKPALWINEALRWVTSNVGQALTHVNPGTWLRNLGGVAMLAPEMGERVWRQGLAGFKNVTVDELTRLSPIFWERYTRTSSMVLHAMHGAEQGGEIGVATAGKATLRQLFEAGKDLSRGRVRKALEGVAEADKPWRQLKDAIHWANWFDSRSAAVAFRGFEREAARLHPEWTKAQRERWAIRKAEVVFERTQNTNDTLNQSGWAADVRENPVVGLFTMFTSDIAKKRNMLYQAFKAKDNKKIAAVMGAIAANIAWSGGISYVVKRGLDEAQAAIWGQDEDGDRALSSMWRRVADELSSMVPIAGRTVVPAVRRFTEGQFGTSGILDNPVTALADDIENGLTDLVRAGTAWWSGEPRKSRRELTPGQRALRGAESLGAALLKAVGGPVVPWYWAWKMSRPANPT